MDSNKKKKLIQKIRNRMSAQRSRLRQKRVLSDLEMENQNLLDANQSLVEKVKTLEEENQKLKSMINNQKPENKFSISTDLDSVKDLSQCNTISRNDPVLNMKNDTFFKTLYIVAIFCLLTIFTGGSYHNQAVKIGGLTLFKNEKLHKNTIFFAKNLKHRGSSIVQSEQSPKSRVMLESLFKNSPSTT